MHAMLSGNRKEQELLNDAELLAEHETAESWHCLRGALGFWCLDFGMSDLGVRFFFACFGLTAQARRPEHAGTLMSLCPEAQRQSKTCEPLSKLRVSPFNNPYSSPLYNPLYNPLLRCLDYSSCINPPVSMFELLGLSCRDAGFIPEGEPSSGGRVAGGSNCESRRVSSAPFGLNALG